MYEKIILLLYTCMKKYYIVDIGALRFAHSQVQITKNHA